VEVVVGDGDPEIHGIGSDEGLVRRELIHHLELVERVHVGEDNDGRGGGLGGHLRCPVLQDVDGDGEGVAGVHVLVVRAGPREGIAFRALEAGGGDVPGGEEIQVLLGEILADDADQMDGRGEIGGGETGEGSGAAEEVFPFRGRGLDVVDGDGAADEDGGVGNGHGRVLNFKTQN